VLVRKGLKKILKIPIFGFEVLRFWLIFRKILTYFSRHYQNI